MFRTSARPRSRALLPALLPATGLALALALTGCGTDTSSDTSTDQQNAGAASREADIVVGDPWVRATEGTQDTSMTAAFMTIDNNTDSDITLLRAESSVAGAVQLHEIAMVDEEMVMREVEGGITITARRGKLLESGGYHLMLVGLTRDLAPGDEVDLALTFSDGSSQQLTVPVKEFVEEAGHYHDPGTGDHAHPTDQGTADGGMDGSMDGSMDMPDESPAP